MFKARARSLIAQAVSVARSAAGDLGDVARRHGAPDSGLQVDVARVRRDLLIRVEAHALGRDRKPFAHRLLRMAQAAAADDDVARFPNSGRATAAASRAGAGPNSARSRRVSGKGREPRREHEGDGGDAPAPPQLAALGVHGVEEMPDRDADDDDEPDDDEIPAAREGERIMVRQHQEDAREA